MCVNYIDSHFVFRFPSLVTIETSREYQIDQAQKGVRSYDQSSKNVNT